MITYFNMTMQAYVYVCMAFMLLVAFKTRNKKD